MLKCPLNVSQSHKPFLFIVFIHILLPRISLQRHFSSGAENVIFFLYKSSYHVLNNMYTKRCCFLPLHSLSLKLSSKHLYFNYGHYMYKTINILNFHAIFFGTKCIFICNKIFWKVLKKLIKFSLFLESISFIHLFLVSISTDGFLFLINCQKMSRSSTWRDKNFIITTDKVTSILETEEHS